jgi:hypothetical protein
MRNVAFQLKSEDERRRLPFDDAERLISFHERSDAQRWLCRRGNGVGKGIPFASLDLDCHTTASLNIQLIVTTLEKGRVLMRTVVCGPDLIDQNPIVGFYEKQVPFYYRWL